MTPLKRLSKGFFFLLLSVAISHCSREDADFDPVPDNLVSLGRTKAYKLFKVSDSDVSGTATLIEKDQGYTTINISLTNTEPGLQHPVFLHGGFTGAEGGGKVRSLGFVDGNTGKSSITISKLDNENAISFDELLEYEGYINVVRSSSELGTDLSQGDIGPNELNGNVVEYALGNEEEGVIGKVTFNERLNGTTLVVVGLENTPEAGDYPSLIKTANDVTAITLKPVNGKEGFGQSQVEEFDDGTPVTYSELILFEGTIEVFENAGGDGRVIASGTIGPE